MNAIRRGMNRRREEEKEIRLCRLQYLYRSIKIDSEWSRIISHCFHRISVHTPTDRSDH